MLDNRAEIYLTSDRAQLSRAVDQIFAQQPEIVVICGGDGAQHVCLTMLANRYAQAGVALPQILMLALGTMNDAASSLKVNHPVSLLRDVLSKLDRGQSLEIKLFRPMTVNGEIAFMYGAGIPVAFLERYYRDKPAGAGGGSIGGFLTVGTVVWSEIFIELGLADNQGWLQRLLYLLGLGDVTGWLNELLDILGMSDAAEWQAKDLLVRFSSESLDQSTGDFVHYTGLMASVISQIGLGFKAFPHTMNHQGSFTLLTTNLSFAEIIACAPFILLGDQVEGIDNRVLKRVVIEYSQPTVRAVDGDIKDPFRDPNIHPTKDVLGIGPILEIIMG
ncbi:hypothetical protein KKF05_03660 [Patescibacteria group bacterium]|nr:hypothetical protein [Patescibacteria group bacterium]